MRRELAFCLTVAILLGSARSAPAQRRGSGRRPEGGGRGGGRPGGSQREWSFSSSPTAKDAVERKILEVLQAMEKDSRRMRSVPMDDGRFLRILTESTGAKHVVEVGTSQGYSALWFCLALRRTGGKLTTYEIDPTRAEIAKGNFEKAGVSDIATVVLGDAHEKVTALKGPIDIVFLDADKSGYLDYLRKLLPKVRPGGLVIAHNINPRQADPLYVDAITDDKELETLLVNLQAWGISVSMKKR